MEHPSPTPAEIIAERTRAGWRPSGAAAAVCVSERAWRNWEAGNRKMPASTWLLFTLLTGRRTIAYETGAGRAILKLRVEIPRSEEVSTIS
jgi:hypothetical protein